MTSRTGLIDAALHRYLQDVCLREPPVLARLRAATASRPEAAMQISPEQGQFLQMLVHLLGARRCIEVGTYTGYSALAVALALPPDGKLIACDISDEFTSVGRPFWREAGVESRIDLRIQPALLTLDALLREAGGPKGYDFAFVDADKTGYIDYYERLLQLVRPGGLIAVDNTLGLSSRPVIELDTVMSRAVRAFNAHVHRDERVEIAMLPLGEGVTLLRVR
jgi:predicted O-methyltransferase YrrM